MKATRPLVPLPSSIALPTAPLIALKVGASFTPLTNSMLVAAALVPAGMALSLAVQVKVRRLLPPMTLKPAGYSDPLENCTLRSAAWYWPRVAVPVSVSRPTVAL